MIVLHKQKIIALKARKVGGTSFEIALSKFANKDSIITPITLDDEKLRESLGYLGPQNYKYKTEEIKKLSLKKRIGMNLNEKKRLKFYNHIPAYLVKQRLGDNIWNTYTKIAIIRNPFDYMVSSFFWEMKTKKKKTDLSFEEYVLKRKDKIKANEKIYKINNENIIDYKIRYDNLQTDILNFESKCPTLSGLSDTFVRISAKGQYRPKNASTVEMFKNAPFAKELIQEICKEDIKLHNFKVPV